MRSRSRLGTFYAILATALAIFASISASHSSAAQWNDIAGGNWSDSAKWTPATVPNAIDAIADFSTLNIAADTTINLNGSFTAGTLLFGDTSPSNNWIISPSAPANTLTLAVSSGSPIVSVSNPTAAPIPSTNSIVTFPFLDQTATIGAVIAGSNGLTKTGLGTLRLTAANTYSGTTSVKAGALALDFSAAGAPASNVLNSSSSLSLGGGLGTPGGGALRLIGAPGGTNSQTFAGTAIDLGLNVINVNQNGATSVNIALGTVSRANHGVLNMTLPVAGTTTISASNASIPNVNGIIGGWATVGTGSSASWATNDGSGNILPLTTFTDVPAAGTITSDAASNVRFTGGNISAPAGTTVVNSVLMAEATSRTLTIPSGATLRVGSGGIFKTDNTTNTALTVGATGGILTAGAAVDTAADLILNANALTPDLNGIVVPATVTNNGTGAVSVVTSGNAAVQLNVANSYTGGTFINSGRLRANAAGAFGTGDVYVGTGGQAYLNAGTFANNFILSSKGFYEAATFFSGGAIRLAANGVTISGNVTLAGDSRIGARGAGAAGGVISGKITGSGALELGGSATLGVINLSNSANDWTGDTTILLGTVKVAATAGEVIPNGTGKGNVIISGDPTNPVASTLDLNGKTETINGLVSAGEPSRVLVNSSAGVGTLIVGDNNATASFGGVLQNGAGTLNLTKIGTGTQTLTGNNTHSGVTTINGGILALSTAGTNNIPSSNVVVGAAGELAVAGVTGGFSPGTTQTITNNGKVSGPISMTSGTLAGTGNYLGTVTMTGGTVAPGSNGLGTVSVNNLVGNSGTLLLEIGGASSDKILATTASFSGTTLTMSLLSPATQSTYDVLTSSSPISGTPTIANPIVGRTSYSIDPSPNNIIRVKVVGLAANLTWNNQGGAGDGASWDIETNQNWKNGAASDKYFEADKVTFNDTNNNHYTVNVVGTVNPGSVTVDNSVQDYVFNGGSIGGVGGLTKNGSKALTINSDIAYSGNTTINGGTVTLAGNNSGSSAFAVNATATLNLSGTSTGTSVFTANSGGAINLTADYSFSPSTFATSAGGALNVGNGGTTGTLGATVLPNNGSITFNRNDSFTVASTITGSGTVTQNSPSTGTVILSGASTYTGATNITSGTIKITNSASLGAQPGGAVTVSSGAALDISGNGTAQALNFGQKQFFIAGTGVNNTGALLNSSTGVSQFNTFQRVTLTADALIGAFQRFDIRAGQVAGVNTAQLDLAGFTLTKMGTNHFGIVNGDVTAGDIVVNEGIFAFESATKVLAANKPNSQPSTITYNASALPTGTTFQVFGGSANQMTITRPIIVNTNANNDPVFFRNNNAQESTVASPVTMNSNIEFNANAAGSLLRFTGDFTEQGGPRSITKSSANTLILAGNMGYTGTTTINAGTLQLGASNRLSDVTNMVMGGTTPIFHTGGFSETLGTLTLQVGGTLDLGAGASVVHFAASDLTNTWSGNSLTINNWTPIADHVFFGNSALGLGATTTFPTFQISFTGHGSGARILSTGEVLPQLSVLQGDFDQDGAITAADLPAMLKALTDVQGFKSAYAMSDSDFDTITNLDASPGLTNRDIQAMLDKMAGLGLGSVASVPEPASLGLLALGTVCAFGLRKQIHRRTRSS
jgi:fibronectin-binding autotransporter adhesin